MHGRRWFRSAILGSLAALAAGTSAAGEPPRRFEKVFIVILENEDAAAALRQPYMKALAARGAYLDQFHAVARPSQPNYVALVSGAIHGVTSNGRFDLAVPSVANLLEAKGLTWKTYAEGYPGGCFADDRGKYARKHNPFISFNDIRTSPERCARIVPATQLAQDLATGSLANLSLYIPDNDNNGHDTGVAFADRWLQASMEPYFGDLKFMQGMLAVVTFDESSYSGGQRIYAAFLGDSVRPGAVSAERYTLYSLLRTIEDGFGLGNLGQEDARAAPIAGIWR